jgi:hypothetical protein
MQAELEVGVRREAVRKRMRYPTVDPLVGIDLEPKPGA